MKTRTSMALAAAAFGAAVTDAHADAREDVASSLAYYASEVDREKWSDNDLERARSGDECRKAIATAKKRGLSDTDTIEHYGFGEHPNAKVVDPKAYNKTYAITLADGAWYCDEYEKVKAFQTLRVAIEGGYQTYEWMGLVKPEESSPSSGNRLTGRTKACVEAVDKLLAGGMKGSDTVLVKDKPVALDAARKECTFFVEEATAWEAKSKAHHQGKRDDLVAIYKKAGMKGKRLELFVESGHPDNSGWLAPGCDKFVTDPKKMAKAKKLFTWSEGPAGYVVTKYTFKKDKYTEATRSFSRQEAAYRWCR